MQHFSLEVHPLQAGGRREVTSEQRTLDAQIFQPLSAPGGSQQQRCLQPRPWLCFQCQCQRPSPLLPSQPGRHSRAAAWL